MIEVVLPCKHPGHGRAWHMQPDPDGEVRRVRLCRCGRTTLARLAVIGEAGFDVLAQGGTLGGVETAA